MPQSLALGYEDFLLETAYELDFGRNPDALDAKQRELLHTIIQTGVRQVLSPLIPGSTPPKTHEWSWARPVGTLILRPAIAGTLAAIPQRSGQLIVISANEAVFDSDVVGSDILFTVTGHRYTVVDYVRETVVRVTGSPRAISGQETNLGDYVSGWIATLQSDSVTMEVTETDEGTYKLFTSDMVGDTVVFGSNVYPIIRWVSETKVEVQGGSDTESGPFKVKRRVPESAVTVGSPVASTAVINCPVGTYRNDMAGNVDVNSDVVRFVESGNTYRIVGGLGSSSILVAGPLDQADWVLGTLAAVGDIDIEKSFTAGSSTVSGISTVTPTEDVFDPDRHPGMYLVFVRSRFFFEFEILDVIDYSSNPGTHNKARVAGYVFGANIFPYDEKGQFAIAHAAGRFPFATPPVYDGVTTVLTADSAIFDSGMVGLVVQFHVSGNRYAITKFNSTTEVELAGAADVEEATLEGRIFMVVGPTDFAADDAFALVNTGGDYELPSDYAALDGPLTYGAGDSVYDIEVVGESQIRNLRARSDTAARPKYAAIRPKTYDPKRHQGQVFELLVWPRPSEKKTVTYRYQILYDQIDADHPYPPGGPLLGDLYLASCLAVAEQRVKDKRALRTAEFQEKLAVMIDHDRRAHRSEFIGSMVPRRGYLDPLLPVASPQVSFGGVYYDGS